MSEYDLDSLIVACDFRVEDVDGMWRWMQRQRDDLAEFGAHHVVVYSSLWEPGRILVTIGIREPHSIRELLGSSRVFEWFDIAGVQDIPPIFGGQVVERLDLFEPAPADAIANVIVGAMAAVDDVSNLMIKVRDALDRFTSAGVRRIWVYRALDDGHEVMILQEIESEAAARQWIDHPDAAAEWMTKAGLGAYPSLFVGKFVHLMSVDESGNRMR